MRAWKSLDALRDDAAAKHWLLSIVRRDTGVRFERRRLETVDIDNLTASVRCWPRRPTKSSTTSGRPFSSSMMRPRTAGSAGPVGLQPDREIAEMMELNQGACGLRLHRARSKLRDLTANEVNSGQAEMNCEEFRQALTAEPGFRRRVRHADNSVKMCRQYSHHIGPGLDFSRDENVCAFAASGVLGPSIWLT